MKQISIWGYNHKWVARISIVLLWIFLHGLAFLLSTLIEIPGSIAKPGLIAISIASLFLFYETSFNRKNLHYARRKFYDGCLAFSTFLLLLFSFGTDSYNAQTVASASVHSVIPAKQTVNKTEIEPSKKTFIGKKWKQIRHYVTEIKKEMRDSDKTKKTLLIILTILLGAAAIVLVLALSCGIACNGGGEALAIAAAVVGIAGVIFLAYKIIKRIKNGPKVKPTDSEPAKA